MRLAMVNTKGGVGFMDLQRLKLPAMTAWLCGGCWVHGLRCARRARTDCRMRGVTLCPGR